MQATKDTENAVIYCRVSTTDQAQYGYSLATQEKVCREYAERNGYNVLQVFVEEGESAKTALRTQLQKLLHFLTKNRKLVKVLIVHKIDRFSRDTYDFADLVRTLDKLGVELKSATENFDNTPLGKFMKSMLSNVAQLDNDVRSERTASGMRQAVKEGRWCWQAPVGYDNSEDEMEMPILVRSDESIFVQEAFRLAETGLYKQVDIAKELRKKGFKRATTSLINRMLRNPLYCGIIKVKWFDEEIDYLHQEIAIISRETFYRVQNILDGKRPSVTAKARNNPAFPLRNFLRCGRCGHKLTGGLSTGRKGIRYPYYRCYGTGCGLNTKKGDIEDSFYGYLKTIEPKEEMLNAFEAVVLDVWQERQSNMVKEKEVLGTHLKALEKERDRIDDLKIRDVLTDETYKRKAEEVKAKMEQKRREFEDSQQTVTTDMEGCVRYCKAVIANVADLWASGSLDLKQRLQTIIFPDKTYYDNRTIRTDNIALIFKHLQQMQTQKTQVVALSGFEPES